MDTIQADLASIATAQAIAVEFYSRGQAEQVATQLRKKFGRVCAMSDALWESLDGEGLHYGENFFR